MKKNKLILLGSIAIATICIASTSLYAATMTGPTGSITDNGGASGASLDVKLSPGVQLGYMVPATGATAGTTYAINTNNTKIAKAADANVYGFDNEYAGYYQRVVGGTAFAAPTVGNSSDFSSGYTKK